MTSSANRLGDTASMREYNGIAKCLVVGALAALTLLAGCATSGGPPEPAAALPTAPQDNRIQRPTPPASEAPKTAPAQTAAHRTDGAHEPRLRTDAPLRYVVKKGDTLWDIAGYFLKNPWYWPELWYANPQIENPHLIYPGDVLELVWVNGRPRLRRIDTVVHLEPRVRELPIQTAIPTIPVEAIRSFLDAPRLVTPAQLQAAPYIVQFVDGHLIGSDGLKIYVRHAQAENGRAYAVVRAGEVYRDPKTGEVLGYEAIPVGTARILDFGPVDTGVLTETAREALTGDRLLPVVDGAKLASDFYPHTPDHPVDGVIISATHGIAQIGQYDIVVLNRGAKQGIERGHVLAVYQTGRHARDPFTGEMLALPPLRAGILLVFKVENRVSYGLVMSAERPIHVGDSVHRPGAV